MRTLLIAILFILTGCVSTPSQDIPPQVVEWSQANVWKIMAGGTTGSGFWIDNETMLTNCHVIGDEKKVLVQSSDLKLNKKMNVVACNTNMDLAMLKYRDSEELNFTPVETVISNEMPRDGRMLYGPGYPGGFPLHITTGHWQRKVDDGYLATLVTFMGDSGSPAIIWDGKKVVVVSMRAEVLTRYQGPVSFRIETLIPHIVTIKEGPRLLKFIKKYSKEKI